MVTDSENVLKKGVHKNSLWVTFHNCTLCITARFFFYSQGACRYAATTVFENLHSIIIMSFLLVNIILFVYQRTLFLMFSGFSFQNGNTVTVGPDHRDTHRFIVPEWL